MGSPNQARYRELSRGWDDLPVFVRDWYLDAAVGPGSWNVALAEHHGEVAGALPYYLKRRGPLHYITMPVLTKWMGPYLPPRFRELKFEHRIYADLIDRLPPYAAFKQQFHPGVSNWLPFYWRGFRQTTRYTYRLSLDDLDRVYHGINRNLRRNLNKAERQVAVTTGDSTEDLYRLIRLSFGRQGLTPPYTLDDLKRFDRALADHGARQLFFATDDRGDLHSAACLIWDNHTAYYHLSGDDPALRDSGAGIAVLWAAIRYTREQLGLRSFDFEGSMLAPVEAMRRQFGARQHPYSLVWRYRSPLLAAVDRLRGRYPR